MMLSFVLNSIPKRFKYRTMKTLKNYTETDYSRNHSIFFLKNTSSNHLKKKRHEELGICLHKHEDLNLDPSASLGDLAHKDTRFMSVSPALSRWRQTDLLQLIS